MTDHNNKSVFQQNEISDWMIKYTFHVRNNPDVIAVKYPRYSYMYCQYGSYDTQQTAKEVHEILKNDFPDMSFNAIVIVRAGMIHGPACYDHVSNNLFVSEELSDHDKFRIIVDETYFPVRNLRDVILHEVGGHKRHWNSILSYYYQNQNQFENVTDAKIKLEAKLHKYVTEKVFLSPLWISKQISFNAYDSFTYPRNEHYELNELIADAIVLKSKKKLKDSQLWKLSRVGKSVIAKEQRNRKQQKSKNIVKQA